MKKILFLMVIAATLFAASSFTSKKEVAKKSSITLSITSVERTADGNKVFFEITGEDPLKFIPALLVSATYKGGRYDWGGNPFPHEVVTVGGVTTGYFLDEPIQGSRRRWYSLYYWDEAGNVILSPVYAYVGK